MKNGTYKIIAVADLVPYEKNARTHSKDQVEQIARSIETYGFTNPLLVDEQNRIIAGHGRLAAAGKLNLSEVPCIVLAGLTEEARRALVLADNKLALNAGWDIELLTSELADLKIAGFDLSLTGFSLEEIDDLFDSVEIIETKDPDDAPDLPAEPVTREGDVWILGPHRLVCGDSTSIDNLNRLMAGAMADVCWTDPPYNVAYESKGHKAIANDDLSDKELVDFLLASFGSMFSVLKPGGAVYVAHPPGPDGRHFFNCLIGAGFKLQADLVWRKDSLVLGRSDYQWMHASILYGWKPGSAHRWYGGRKLTTIHDLGDGSPFTQREDGSFEVRMGDRVLVVQGEAKVEELVPSVINEAKPKKSADHPTMKPVALIERMLRNNARPNDIVLDLFGGSGSTLIAAERLGMCARLSELSPGYCDVIVKRYEEYTGRKAVLEVRDGESET